MSDTESPQEPAAKPDPILLVLESQSARLKAIEDGAKRTFFKTLTQNAGTGALFLGLILSLASLYNVFVTEPRTAKIAEITAFNDVINRAAKTRQDLMVAQLQTSDHALRLSLSSAATPQILNYVATAKVILARLSDFDVRISQLSILIFESLTAGDLASAKIFVDRALNNPYATAFELSEAKRYEARYLFITNQPEQAREAFISAIDALVGDAMAGARAYDLVDWAAIAYSSGQCTQGDEAFKRLGTELATPNIPIGHKQQLVGSLESQLGQLHGKCNIPQNFSSLIVNTTQ